MKAIIQVVKSAKITINGEYGGNIGRGMVVFSAYKDEDNEDSVLKMTDKILNLRVFPDKEGKLNLSLMDIGGSLMSVSNFTLYGDATHGRRPSYTMSAKPEISKPLYELTVSLFKKSINVISGVFGADMQVELINDGPITLVLEN